MRKKLFAVIMSVMMMVTFMPAMAFAYTETGDLDSPKVEKAYSGFYVDGFSGPQYGQAVFTYDAKDHEVSYYLNPSWQFWKGAEVSYYTVTPYTTRTLNTTTGLFDFTGEGKTTKSVEAPKLKNAGNYRVTAAITYYGAGTLLTEWLHIYTQRTVFTSINVVVKQRNVAVKGFGTLELTKAYDGKGFSLTDKDFTISACIDPDTGKERPNTGLCDGDTLLVNPITTRADVGVYDITSWASVNKNYAVYAADLNGYDPAVYPTGVKFITLRIVQADNEAKIASNTMTIKRGSSKAVKYSTTWGTAKLTKLSGNTKISVANGKVKVAKSLKKGTYKIQVKCSAAGTNNWAKASRTKTLTIKVK